MLTYEILNKELSNYNIITLNQLSFGFLPISNCHFCLMTSLNKKDGIDEWKNVIVDYFKVYIELLENFPKIEDKKMWKEKFNIRLQEEMQEKNIASRLAFLEQNTVILLHEFDKNELFQQQLLQYDTEVPKYCWMVFESG